MAMKYYNNGLVIGNNGFKISAKSADRFTLWAAVPCMLAQNGRTLPIASCSSQINVGNPHKGKKFTDTCSHLIISRLNTQ